MAETKQQVFESLLKDFDTQELLDTDDYDRSLHLLGRRHRHWERRYATAIDQPEQVGEPPCSMCHDHDKPLTAFQYQNNREGYDRDIKFCEYCGRRLEVEPYAGAKPI